MARSTFQRSTRIILAVAAKDIIEAVKNRTLLVITLGVLVLLLTGPLMSMLITRSQPVLVMNESASPELIQSLQEHPDLRLVLADSQEQMNSVILQPPQAIIGVVVPEDLPAGQAAEFVLAGYTAHWVTESRVQKLMTFFENVLGKAAGESVRIKMERRLYPSHSEGNQFSMIAMSLTTMILLMGLSLVPYLFIEEKESHTMDALRVSPARFWQLVAGKLIAGAVYCLVAAVIVLLINFRIVVHWELMVSVVLVGTAFAVAIGLLLGMLFDNAATMGLWTSLLVILLLFSPILQTMGVGKIPAFVQNLMTWLPSTMIYNLAGLAMLGELPVGKTWPGILMLIGSTFIICLLVVWRIRRLDR